VAQHIDSVDSSGITQVTGAQFFNEMRPGDLVFCWGNIPISHGIEQFTGGPSHVLKVWLPFSTGPWLTMEAELEYGVRIGPFSDYLSYPGDIVLCRRSLTLEQVEAELDFGATLLDYKYDTIEFASLVARRFSTKFPIIQPAKELYCSGLQQAIAAVSVPFSAPDVPWATPDQLFTDTSVVTICALLEGEV
jgi:hypothetical protein